MPHRGFAALAALFGLMAVAMGAFAAHAMAGDPKVQGWLETGSRYQMWHALAMLAYMALGRTSPWPLWLFTIGIVLFSLSLYALALGAPLAVAMVTPVGGTALIAGWGLTAWALLRQHP